MRHQLEGTNNLNKILTVQRLRQAGYMVRVYHYRRSVQDPFGKPTVLPNGGYTVVTVKTPEGITYTERADCSNQDQYNKKIGVQICIGRMFKKHRLSVPVQVIQPKKLTSNAHTWTICV